VIILARKRSEESSGGNAPWLNTFADLMNLLLCFFVMLFAMSDISNQKFSEIAISLTNAFSIFDHGGSSIGEGVLISSGMTQLSNLDEFISNMGEKTQETGDDIEDDDLEGELDDAKNKGTHDELDAAKRRIMEEMALQSEEMYEEVEMLTEQYNLGDYMELSIDPEFNYVQLTIKGSILFESGKADIIEEAKPVLTRIGDILAFFEGHIVEIIGHTDNVPMTSPAFKDNNWLSTARALNAAEFLIENNKLEPSRIKFSGRGEYEPIATNDTPEGRLRNRRIEIRIYKELSSK
jgi:chemotaxis protein MotB